MKLRHATTTVLVLLAAAMPLPAQATPHALMQTALYKQQIEGDLREAARLFQQLADDYGEDRAVAARALVLLGRVRETMGSGDAPGAYRRVVRDYPEQLAAVKEAEARLAVLAPAGVPSARDGLVARHLTTLLGAFYMPGLVSPDGGSVLYTDWQGVEGAIWPGTGALVSRNTITGTSTMLAKGDSTVENYVPAGGMWSPDGKRVAYAIFSESWDHQVLRVVNADGTGDRVLSDNRQHVRILPGAWSSDGSFIATYIEGWDETIRIALVSVPDGKVSTLKTLAGEVKPSQLWEQQLSVSPDGRFIAYAWPDQYGNNELFVLATDGSSEVPVAPHATDDDTPFWTPDGKRLVFVSDRAGRRDLLAIEMKDGRPVGEPVSVYSNLGPVRLMGFTGDGSLAYAQPLRESNVFVSDLDWAANAAANTRRLSDRFVGTNRDAAWSPDGTRLAYLSERTGTGLETNDFLVIKSLQDGSERDIALDSALRVLTDTRPAWTEDGTAILLHAEPIEVYDMSARRTYRVDVASGRIERDQYMSDAAGFGEFGRPHPATARQRAALRAMNIRLSGQRDFFRYQTGNEPLRPGERLLSVRYGITWIHRWDCDAPGPAGSECKVINQGNAPATVSLVVPRGAASQWDLSPDGHAVAYTGLGALSVWSLNADEAPRELLRAEPGTQIGSPRWTPDGRYVLYAVMSYQQDSSGTYLGWKNEVRRVSLGTGAVDTMHLPADFLLGNAEFSADAKTVAWSPRLKLGVDVWTLSGFPWQDRSKR